MKRQTHRQINKEKYRKIDRQREANKSPLTDTPRTPEEKSSMNTVNSALINKAYK